MTKDLLLNSNSMFNRNVKIPLNINQPTIAKFKSDSFTIKIATTNKEKESVRRLGKGLYMEKGFLNENAIAWLIQKNNSKNVPYVLIVQDQQNNIAGSISIFSNGNTNLSVEKKNTNEIKATFIKMGNLLQTAIGDEPQNSNNISTVVFNYLTSIKRRVIPLNINEKEQSLFMYVLNNKHENFAANYLDKLNKSNENKTNFFEPGIRMAIGL